MSAPTLLDTQPILAPEDEEDTSPVDVDVDVAADDDIDILTDAAPAETAPEAPADTAPADTEAEAATPAAPTATPAPPAPTSQGMQVRKRNGQLEPVDVTKIIKAVERSCEGLTGVDPMRVATKTISGLSDGTTTVKLDDLSIRTAAGLMVEEPSYSKLAARLLSAFIDKEVGGQNVHSFSQSVELGHSVGVVGDATAQFIADNSRKLNDAIAPERSDLFEFFGLRIIYDRYLLCHPETRKVIETPQHFLLRVACGLSTSANDAIAFYDLMSSLAYLPSSPTLFNSGTAHPQMSSCYLLDSPQDDLKAIYDRYTDIALLSKHAGGIGLSYSRVRSAGSLIRGTNGVSNGIIPWLKTLDSSVCAVNQGGRRKGAACVYLESWHADIEDFLELKDNTGDESRRTHNLNLANWIPDLFMERVEQDGVWSLFDPKRVPHLVDLYGEDFRRAYLEAEEAGQYERQVSAQDLYRRMMRTLAQTGNGWMTFKDSANMKCNQTGAGAGAGADPTATADHDPARVVHLSNLCTEILEVTNNDETAVCNLGSINVGRLVSNGEFDFDRLGEIVQTAVPFLDRVVDINYYPITQAENSNSQWRPVGLGLMGLQDVFFKLKLPFDSPEARQLSKRISEEIYYWALMASCQLAQEHGPHPTFARTRAAAGDLQYALWGLSESELSDPDRWNALRDRIAQHGLRNSLLIAIAPTATIASIAGCYECIEPQVSNLFKRETLSGEFLQINTYLVRDLQDRGMWNDEMIADLKRSEGSIQNVSGIPDEMKSLYRTAWELPMRSLIDMAAERGAFIDQSQSLNLFMEEPNISKLSSMYLHAWKSGLKTTYYLRSRAATRISQATVGAAGAPDTTDADATAQPQTDAQANPQAVEETIAGDSADEMAETIACSLENPETCEACD